jgi:hypothetical protein
VEEMLLTAKIEFNENRILEQIEKTRKAQTALRMELDELEEMLRKVTLKEVGDSKESPEG